MGRYVFKMPDIGEGTTEAEIAAWHVEVGSLIREDEPLLDLMTNKATVEITAPVSGRVTRRNGEVGDVRPIGTELVVFETSEAAETNASPRPDIASGPHPEPVEGGGRTLGLASPTPLSPDAADEGRAPAAKMKSERSAERAPRPLASPAVRQRALDLGIALETVRGTGPAGRVTHQDLDAHGKQGPAPRPPAPDTTVTEVRIVGIRRIIAERLQDTKRRIPHFTYVEEIDVTALEALRAELNVDPPDGEKLTLLPFLIRALVRALPDFPQINARFDDTAGVLHQHAGIHVGIATQTPNGLMVPVLRDAATKSLFATAVEIRRLATEARAGKLSKEELSGSTITITSLGALGGLVSTPVINAPETAIIGVNRVSERPAVVNGAVVIRKMMNLSSSFDHRIVDGFDAARFIQAVRSLLQQPALLFVERP